MKIKALAYTAFLVLSVSLILLFEKRKRNLNGKYAVEQMNAVIRMCKITLIVAPQSQ